jgi:hypothetical protein
MTQISNVRCFEITKKYSTDNTGYTDFITIPFDVDRTAVQLRVESTATAVIQASISTIEEIEAGLAIWKDWDIGSVVGGNTAQDATRGPIGGIRVNVLVAAPGDNAVVSIRAQSGHV